MGINVIATDKAPAAIGPYSQAVRVGEFLYCSGQIPLDPKTGELVPGGIVEQTEQVMTNIRAVLTEVGADFDKVIKTTIFMQDLQDFAEVNNVYARYFSGPAPARSTVQVAGLPKGALVEIETVAFLG